MHSHHNGLKTAALLGLLTAMILAVGYWLGGSGGLVFAVLLSLAINAGSYFFSDKLALRAMRAQPVSSWTGVSCAASSVTSCPTSTTATS